VRGDGTAGEGARFTASSYPPAGAGVVDHARPMRRRCWAPSYRNLGSLRPPRPNPRRLEDGIERETQSCREFGAGDVQRSTEPIGSNQPIFTCGRVECPRYAPKRAILWGQSLPFRNRGSTCAAGWQGLDSGP
jgi:hypothetical protein